jgi:uncharacterized SAM-dependent methyltransferase
MLSTLTLLTETDIADDFVTSFHERRLSEKFFYWFPLSVRAWLALCSDGEYRNYVRSRSLVATSAAELSSVVPPGLRVVVSLGSGQGDKDAILLSALVDRGIECAYMPVDASQALLELACRQGGLVGVATRGVKADFTRPEHLEALASAVGDAPRLVLLLGNTLGSLDPIAFARSLADWLRPGDLLLLDGELYEGETTLAGYDNPINRRFAWAPLNSIGIGESDGTLVFENLDDARRPGLHLVPKHFHATRQLETVMGGETLRLESDQRLEMSQSYKYSEQTFTTILQEAGLSIRWRGVSDDQRFLMVMASRD